MHVPSSCLDYFELSDVKNNTGNWELLLEEKVDLIPQALSKQLVVLGGFHNDLNVLSHSFSLKPIYLVIRRRRWKPKGGGKHYSNQYNYIRMAQNGHKNLWFFKSNQLKDIQ